jgi:hypothetical protein
MSFDLAFVPRDQDRLDIREVLVQRGARPTPVSVTICDTPPLISAACRTPSPVLHAAAALLPLLTATVLAGYKPRGHDPIRVAQAAEGAARGSGAVSARYNRRCGRWVGRSRPTHLPNGSGIYPMVNSWVCGFRWPSFWAPATALSCRSQMIRPRVMSDS